MKFILTVFIIMSSLQMMSQKKGSFVYNRTPLNDVIIELEKEFDIKLSFNSELIENQFVTFQSEDALLESVLNAIEGQTNIEFFKVSERYYILKHQATIDLTTTQKLNEVVVNEYLTSGVYKETDGSFVISPINLGILPGLTEPDVLQSLQLFPGIQSPSETASGLYVRGGTPDQNLILWDGIKMYHSGHFFDMISAFNPYITEEVNFYTGGTKAKYGSRISSVIDITSFNKIPEKIEGGAGFNMLHADFYIKVPVNRKIAIIGSVRRSFTDAFKSITFNNISKRIFQNTKISDGKKIFQGRGIDFLTERFYFIDHTIKTIIKPDDNNKITFSNIYNRNELDNEFSGQFDQSISDNIDINNRGSSVLWNHNYNRTFSHAFQAYYSNFDLDYSGLSYNENEEVTLYETIKRNMVHDFGMSFDTNWKINKKSKLGLGYQLSSNKIHYQLEYGNQVKNNVFEVETFIDKHSNNSHAFYSDYAYKNSNKLTINVGLRANYISTFKKFFFEPRLHLNTQITPCLKFKSSVEQLHQEVSQIVEFETKDFGLENQIWVLADGVNIPILKSFQLTGGFLFNKDGWHIGIDGYIKKVNGITSLTRGFDNNEENKNFFQGKSDVLGLDILIKKKIDNYRTWLSYSLINNRFTFKEVNEGYPFPGNFDIKHHFTWAHSYSWNNFNVSLGWNIRTGRPYTRALNVVKAENDFGTKYTKINSNRLPFYNRLDVSAFYKFNLSSVKNKWNAKIGLSILNVTNTNNLLKRTYREFDFVDQGSTNTVFQEIDKFSLGITPNLSFRVKF
ncbi:TonB-dependent receptor domain-containing protein [Flavivirga algicola]|uniref:TonB-dependent receptor plug domain-containing protein n=1 Tax=Flavivirga algicola TaxID=2729136 RepID=A0ABX1S3L8_9FLAO|nr:TonB-dependent receptor [Flavivirga algicola]NMH89349.1 TonB-dependent receptor plug domain-containing protein [Flavivirga algicola]